MAVGCDSFGSNAALLPVVIDNWEELPFPLRCSPSKAAFRFIMEILEGFTPDGGEEHVHSFVIDKWDEDPEFPVHPIGSQPKRVVIAPFDAAAYGLKPYHTYIFKQAKVAWQGAQLWSEIIAYRMAELVGVNAPRCFPAIVKEKNQAGVLMESFLGGADQGRRFFVHGADILGRIIADKKKGRPHSLIVNMKVSRIVCSPSANMDNWWVKTIFFDALIGNSDRHPQNWGFIYEFDDANMLSQTSSEPIRASRVFMGPAFDNGTSLGYEIQEPDLERKAAPVSIDQYVSRGCHHCTWEKEEKVTNRGDKHIELCDRLIQQDPSRSHVLKTMMSYDKKKVSDLLDECVACDFPLQPFSQKRAYYVFEMLERRRMALLNLVK